MRFHTGNQIGASDEARTQSAGHLAIVRRNQHQAIWRRLLHSQATVSGPSKIVRLNTSVLATCGPCCSPRGAKKKAPVLYVTPSSSHCPERMKTDSLACG